MYWLRPDVALLLPPGDGEDPSKATEAKVVSEDEGDGDDRGAGGKREPPSALQPEEAVHLARLRRSPARMRWSAGVVEEDVERRAGANRR